MLQEIQHLKDQQRRLRDDRKKVAKDLRNAERRRSRLKKRAKLLSDTDLAAVLSLRQIEKAQTAESKAAASSAQREASSSSSDELLGSSQQSK